MEKRLAIHFFHCGVSITKKNCENFVVIEPDSDGNGQLGPLLFPLTVFDSLNSIFAGVHFFITSGMGLGMTVNAWRKN